jgi:hypothetical protein
VTSATTTLVVAAVPDGVLERESGERGRPKDAKQEEDERQRHHADFDGRRPRLRHVPTLHQLNRALARLLTAVGAIVAAFPLCELKEHHSMLCRTIWGES